MEKVSEKAWRLDAQHDTWPDRYSFGAALTLDRRLAPPIKLRLHIHFGIHTWYIELYRQRPMIRKE